MIEDYYKLFEIPKNASNTEIKSAFRTLAKKYHPDKNDQPDAAKRFSEIRIAYSILIDPESRKVYDDALYRTKPTDEYKNLYKKTHEKNGNNREKAIWLILYHHFDAHPKAFILIIVGFVAIGFLVRQFFEDSNTNWIETTAQYESNSINERMKDGQNEYYIKLFYSYLVDGKSYNLSIGEVMSSNQVYNIKPEQQLQVYYKEKTPEVHQLELRVQVTLGFFLTSTFVMLLVTWMFYWLMRVSYKYYYE
ncbi:MAG: DnaJ domain-containing protein [Cyclobacteriaceae bacterium]